MSGSWFGFGVQGLGFGVQDVGVRVSFGVGYFCSFILNPRVEKLSLHSAAASRPEPSTRTHETLLTGKP